MDVALTSSLETSTAATALLERQLIVVTGKGGVGKSVVTAALAGWLAAQGRRTLALEVDPRENLHGLFDAPPSGGETAPVGDRLWVQNLKPADVVDWVVERQVKVGLLIRRLKASPIYGRFVDGAPGLTEIAILGHAQRLLEGRVDGAPALDTVVLDAPATGHGLYLLTAPRLFVETLDSGPFADIAGEVAELVADAGRCGVVVVTLAEEMPVQEALELRHDLGERFGRPPELLVVNALYPAVPSGIAADGDGAVELWRRRRRVNERELARLSAEWPGPRVDLDLVPAEGAALVDVLRPALAAALAAGETA